MLDEVETIIGDSQAYSGRGLAYCGIIKEYTAIEDNGRWVEDVLRIKGAGCSDINDGIVWIILPVDTIETAMRAGHHPHSVMVIISTSVIHEILPVEIQKIRVCRIPGFPCAMHCRDQDILLSFPFKHIHSLIPDRAIPLTNSRWKKK